MKTRLLGNLEVSEIGFGTMSFASAYDDTAKKRFTDNRDRFVDGEDFFLIKRSEKSEIRTFGIEVPNRGLTLITRRGYLKIVKSLNDDTAGSAAKASTEFHSPSANDHAILHLNDGVSDVASKS